MITNVVVSFHKRPVLGLAASPVGAGLFSRLMVELPCAASVEDDSVSTDAGPLSLDDDPVMLANGSVLIDVDPVLPDATLVLVAGGPV